MKIITTLLLLFPLLSLTSCKSQQWPYESLQGDINLQTLLVVDLQTGYEGDMITLWIDGENMIDSLIATTVPESSFTGVKVSFYKGVGNLVPEIIHKFDNNRNDIRNSPIEISSEITIKIRVKGGGQRIVEQSISVDLDEGKYIGLSLSGSKETFFVRQSKQPFNYI